MRQLAPDKAETIIRTDTIAASRWDGRIAAALRRLQEATSPLRGLDYAEAGPAGKGGHGDPTGEHAVRLLSGDTPAAVLARLQELVRQRHENGRAIDVVLNEWAPRQAPVVQRPAENLLLWCTQHLMFGRTEPRCVGHQLCSWCRDVKSHYGGLPTVELIEMHDKGRRIDDATYRKFLEKVG